MTSDLNKIYLGMQITPLSQQGILYFTEPALLEVSISIQYQPEELWNELVSSWSVLSYSKAASQWRSYTPKENVLFAQK